MGKIDKEKLLKECKCLTDGYKFTYCMNQCKNYRGGENFQECITKVIKNFPEEQEIDFDALYNEWCKKTKDWSELRSPYDQARSLRDFLKSKNLTQPQVDMDALRNEIYASIQKPVEIPVKKTWTLKKEYVEFSNDFKAVTDRSFESSCDPVEKLKKYYDLHEELDYSKIPKGSIVELKNSLRRLVIVFNGVLGDKVCGTQNDHYTISNYEIRIVELAKE